MGDEVLSAYPELRDFITHARHGPLCLRFAKVERQFEKLQAEANVIENVAQLVRNTGGE